MIKCLTISSLKVNAVRAQSAADRQKSSDPNAFGCIFEYAKCKRSELTIFKMRNALRSLSLSKVTLDGDGWWPTMMAFPTIRTDFVYCFCIFFHVRSHSIFNSKYFWSAFVCKQKAISVQMFNFPNPVRHSVECVIVKRAAQLKAMYIFHSEKEAIRWCRA